MKKAQMTCDQLTEYTCLIYCVEAAENLIFKLELLHSNTDFRFNDLLNKASQNAKDMRSLLDDIDPWSDMKLKLPEDKENTEQ